ncbi:MAG: hypothetical protein ACQEQO_10565 [Thermodesulfobacteriota bacterium]
MDTLLERPAREPRPPARRAYAPEGTERKPIVFRSRRSHYLQSPIRLPLMRVLISIFV